MVIANQLHLVSVFLTQDGVAAILKQVSTSSVPTSETDRITGQQSVNHHDNGNAAGEQQLVEVFGDQRPDVAFGPGLRQDRF